MNRIVSRHSSVCFRDFQRSSQRLRKPLYSNKDLSGLRACLQPRACPSCNISSSSSCTYANSSSAERRILQSSWNAWVVLCILASGAAIGIELVLSRVEEEHPSQEAEQRSRNSLSQPELDVELSSLFASMAPQPGTLGNLQTEQEVKLKEFWALVLRTFGIRDPSDVSGTDARPITPADASAPAEPASHKKEKRGLFHRRQKESTSSSPSSPAFNSNDPEDKYGQSRDLQEILASSKPEDLHAAFWSMVKNDHPDALMLRFLRARKWDINRALAMLVSTMHWRMNEMHVDDDIMIQGEGGALKDSQSSDPSVKKEASDFLQQMRMGKSFIHGVDKEGRPMCYVRVRLHRGGEQTEKALERYTVYTIETCRLALTAPVETAVSAENIEQRTLTDNLPQTIVFDMTNFTMANMDYTPVKFMIKVFEANYPESLGCVLVHKAPWIFQGIWKIIKGWLDPVVAAKVHFTNGMEDLSEFVPKLQIIKELGGDEAWEYKYIEPTADENASMTDTAGKEKLLQERQAAVTEYEARTFDWIHGQDTNARREQIAQQLRDNYWRLDPIIRARSLYDRTGMIGINGKLNYYPSQTLKRDNLLANAGVNGTGLGTQASADDVD